MAVDLDFISWGQATVLLTIIFTIVTSTGYLTRLIDRKLNIIDYEKKHQELKTDVIKHSIRISLLEERYNNVTKILEKNGFKDHNVIRKDHHKDPHIQGH